jgi:hypothetical protein
MVYAVKPPVSKQKHDLAPCRLQGSRQRKAYPSSVAFGTLVESGDQEVYQHAMAARARGTTPEAFHTL